MSMVHSMFVEHGPVIGMLVLAAKGVCLYGWWCLLERNPVICGKKKEEA